MNRLCHTKRITYVIQNESLHSSICIVQFNLLDKVVDVVVSVFRIGSKRQGPSLFVRLRLQTHSGAGHGEQARNVWNSRLPCHGRRAACSPSNTSVCAPYRTLSKAKVRGSLPGTEHVTAREPRSCRQEELSPARATECEAVPVLVHEMTRTQDQDTGQPTHGATDARSVLEKQH